MGIVVAMAGSAARTSWRSGELVYSKGSGFKSRVQGSGVGFESEV